MLNTFDGLSNYQVWSFLDKRLWGFPFHEVCETDIPIDIEIPTDIPTDRQMQSKTPLSISNGGEYIFLLIKKSTLS